MHFYQKEVVLSPYSRGFHLITEILTENFLEIKRVKHGIFQAFIKHTSASISINENADPTVRIDFERHFNEMVPETWHIINTPMKVPMTCLRI